LKEFRRWGKKSEAERLPDVVWRWDKETLREFIRGLMSCDGSIFRTQNGRPRVEFSVASEGLAKDMHHAFVRFGIVARLYRKSERCWRVQVTDSESVATYQREIGWIGEKAARFQPDLAVFRRNTGHLPVAVWKMVGQAAAMQGPGWSTLAGLSGDRAHPSNFATSTPRTNHGPSQRRPGTSN